MKMMPLNCIKHNSISIGAFKIPYQKKDTCREPLQKCKRKKAVLTFIIKPFLTATVKKMNTSVSWVIYAYSLPKNPVMLFQTGLNFFAKGHISREIFLNSHGKRHHPIPYVRTTT